MDNDVAHTELVGPPNPIVRQKLQALRGKGGQLTDADRTTLAELQAAEDVRLPMTVALESRRRRPRPSTSTVRSITLEPGTMSRWVDLEFRINFWSASTAWRSCC